MFALLNVHCTPYLVYFAGNGNAISFIYNIHHTRLFWTFLDPEGGSQKVTQLMTN